MCHDVRRNSPSVAVRRPMSSCRATTSRIASSSTARRRAASIRPAAKSWRACTSERGRSRLPTWSARNGGSVRGSIGVQPSAPSSNIHPARDGPLAVSADAKPRPFLSEEPSTHADVRPLWPGRGVQGRAGGAMAQRWGPGARLSATVVGCLVAGVLVTGATTAVPGGDATRVLQLNLCNSGLAGCFTGRAVDRAAAVIRAEEPDVVTLNEVCEGDVPVLERALAGQRAGRRDPLGVSRSGGPAHRRRGPLPQRTAVRDRHRGAAAPTPTAGPARLSRPWAGSSRCRTSTSRNSGPGCALNPGTAFTACTTHLDSSSPAVARAQCGYLLRWAVPVAHLVTPAACSVAISTCGSAASRTGSRASPPTARGSMTAACRTSWRRRRSRSRRAGSSTWTGRPTIQDCWSTCALRDLPRSGASSLASRT